MGPLALPRPGRPGRGADLAGPRPRGRSRADRRRGHRRPQGQDPRFGTVGLRAGLDRLGVGLDLPRHRQARRRERRAHPPCPAEGLGRQPAGRTGAVLAALERIQRTSTRADRRQAGLARRPDRAGRLRRRRAGREERRHDVDGSLRAGPHRCDAGADRRRVVRRARTDADGFRNYLTEDTPSRRGPAGRRAQLLTLTAPEMTVLVGGMRALDANSEQSELGVFTDRRETLTNDFFVNLLDMSTEWKPSRRCEHVFEGRDRDDGRAQVDRQPRRPRLRFELPASSPRGGLCE